MRFGIRDVLWLTAVVACLVCWYLERDGRVTTAQRYVVTHEENKRLKAGLHAAQAAQAEAESVLRDLSADRFEELQKLVDELRSETSR
jgi:hypothetical protein